MNTDITTVLAQKKELDGYADELRGARSRLIRHKETLDAAWHAEEIHLIDDALETIDSMLRKTSEDLNSIGEDMVKTFNEVQAEEQAARAKAEAEAKAKAEAEAKVKEEAEAKVRAEAEAKAKAKAEAEAKAKAENEAKAKAEAEAKAKAESVAKVATTATKNAKKTVKNAVKTAWSKFF